MVSSILEELWSAGEVRISDSQGKKRNFAERLSRCLAIKFSSALRAYFDGIKPDDEGRFQESLSRTSKGYKKLDINYSTPELGLALGISIKTINFPDGEGKRYTKNFTRCDNEFRAEAEDYHERQPYSVLIAILFLPSDACGDGERDNWSSFAQAVWVLRGRAKRKLPSDKPTLFERVFIGVYEASGANRGDVWFFDVEDRPPRRNMPRPASRRTFSQLLEEIRVTYDARNMPMEFDEAGLDFVAPHMVRNRLSNPAPQGKGRSRQGGAGKPGGGRERKEKGVKRAARREAPP